MYPHTHMHTYACARSHAHTHTQTHTHTHTHTHTRTRTSTKFFSFFFKVFDHLITLQGGARELVQGRLALEDERSADVGVEDESGCQKNPKSQRPIKFTIFTI